MTTLDRLSAALADRYTIERELGVGGMATVYLATDRKHHRKVAIKVLHPELSAVIGSERFLKEIELTANLQHPHILPLYDSGEAESREPGASAPSTFLYYVMPHVDGESLRRRLEREHQLPIADAVRIASDVADALEYAHRHNVVHRDIKPENILLHEGRPVVADFGIALAVQQASDTRITQTGMSLGTPQYMAPEQAMGDRSVDRRADIYALGAVTYEMLAGEPPFTGHNSQAVVSRVLTERPRDLRTLRDTVPRHVADAVHTALQKLPADRFASAGNFGQALANPGFHAAQPAEAAGGRAERGRFSIGLIALGALALLFGILAAWGWLRPGSAGRPGAPWRLSVTFPDSAAPTTGISLSPDGSALVYGGGPPGDRRLWIRRNDGAAPIAIPGTEGGETPAIAPDGRRVAFRLGRQIMVVPIDGGSPVVVGDSMELAGPFAWLDDDHLIVSNFDGLEKVHVPTATRDLVKPRDTLAGESFFGSPSPLPDGAVLFTLRDEEMNPANFQIAIAETDGRHVVLTRGIRARYAPPGHLLVLRADGAIVAIAFDMKHRRLTGTPQLVMTGIPIQLFSLSGFFDVSETGRLAMIIGGHPRGGVRSELVRVSRSGHAVPIDSTWVESFMAASPSPDGRHIAAGLYSSLHEEIQIRDLRGGGQTRIAIPNLQLRTPTFSPDGLTLVFSGLGPRRQSLYRLQVDGGTAPTIVYSSREPPIWPAFSRDGTQLYFSTMEGASGDLFMLSLGDSGATRREVLATRALERFAFPSPDGRWLSYVSDESGRREVYVRSIEPARAERWQVSLTGVSVGMTPRWSPDGEELFYISRDTMMAARADSGSAFRVASRASLFPTTPYVEVFDVFRTGEFLMIRPHAFDARAHQLVMLEHWNTGSDR